MKKIAMASLLSLLVVGSIAGIAGTAGTALAQGHMMHRMPGPDGDVAMFMSHIADELNLTQEQRDEAKQIHEAVFEKAKPLMEQHRAQMDEIEALLDSGKVTAQEIGTKVIAAHATRKQLEAIHDDAKAQFTALLNDEQKAKLEKMDFGHDKMRMMMHH
jgi:Spy/CpxP family protein refolding chaperone